MKTTTTHSDLVWLAVIVAIGLNLRPLLTSISPLAGVILASTGLSFQGASLLTGLPVVAMGACAFGASALARLVGEARGVAAGLVTIVTGIVRNLTGGFTISWTSLVAMIGLTVVFAPRSYERAMRGKAEKRERGMAQEQRV